jgi:hypothetical protein
MAGRKPRGVRLRAEDIPRLEALVRRGKTEQRVARRARILLEIHRGKRVQEVCRQVGEHRTTVWRVCRRYEARGIEAVYDAPRSGRPRRISPPGAGALGKLGLYKTSRARIGMDPLVGPDFAEGGGPRVHRAEPRSGFARGDVAAASRRRGGTIRLSSGRPRCWNAMNGPGSGGNRGSGWSVWTKSPACRPWSGPDRAIP